MDIPSWLESFLSDVSLLETQLGAMTHFFVLGYTILKCHLQTKEVGSYGTTTPRYNTGGDSGVIGRSVISDNTTSICGTAHDDVVCG